MTDGGSLDADIAQTLSRIHDPCSVASGRPISVLDMGLVRGWRLDEAGALHVTFCVTFGGCTMAPHFMRAAERDLAQLPGVRRVTTVVDADFQWTPDLMKQPFRPMQGTPQAWRTRPAPPPETSRS